MTDDQVPNTTTNAGAPAGTVNADVLEHFSPGFRRNDFVEVIESNAWPE